MKNFLIGLLCLFAISAMAQPRVSGIAVVPTTNANLWYFDNAGNVSFYDTLYLGPGAYSFWGDSSQNALYGYRSNNAAIGSYWLSDKGVNSGTNSQFGWEVGGGYSTIESRVRQSGPLISYWRVEGTPSNHVMSLIASNTTKVSISSDGNAYFSGAVSNSGTYAGGTNLHGLAALGASGNTTNGRIVSAALDGLTISNATVVYSNSVFSDFSTIWTNGVSPTFSANAIRLPAASLNWTQRLELKDLTNSDENVEFVMEYTPSAATDVILIGKRSINNYASNTNGMFSVMFGITNGNQILFRSETATTFSPAKSDFVWASGNKIRLTLRQSKQFFGMEALIISSNRVIRKFYESVPLLGTGPKPPNAGNWAIWNYSTAGNCDVSLIKITSFTQRGAAVAFVGDSKTAFAFGGSPNNRFSELVGNSAGIPVITYAGDSDRAQEWQQALPYLISLRPKLVILGVPRNNQSDTSTNAALTNYTNIVATLLASNIGVKHLLPIPENNTVQAGVSNLVYTNYAGIDLIDPSETFVIGSHLSSDNIHPTPGGHLAISRVILAALFPWQGQAPYYPNNSLMLGTNGAFRIFDYSSGAIGFGLAGSATPAFTIGNANNFNAQTTMSVNNQFLDFDSCGGLSGFQTPATFCGLGLIQVNTNLQFFGGAAFQSNNLPQSVAVATITNGGFYLGTISNLFKILAMSNNTVVTALTIDTAGNVSIPSISSGGAAGIAPTNVNYSTTYLSSGTNIIFDASYGSTNWPTTYRVFLTNNFAFGFTNGTDGQEVIVESTQDTTGSRSGILISTTAGSQTNLVMAAGRNSAPADVSGLRLSTNSLVTDFHKFRFSASAAGGRTNQWSLVSSIRGY